MKTTKVHPPEVYGDPHHLRKTKDLTWVEVPDEASQIAWWQADAWGETIFDPHAFFLTVVYEVFPPLISGVLCCLVEGKASAQNRGLIPTFQDWNTFVRRVLPQTLMTLPVWVMTLVWLIAQPAEVPVIEVAFPFMVLAWRAVCIAMKYAYFSPSDLARIRGSIHWIHTGHVDRQLGLHKFFNTAGTISFDIMEQLFKTVVRNGMLEESKASYLSVHPAVASRAWNRVKPELELENIDGLYSKYVPAARTWRSKYGDVQGMLGLSSLSAIEEQIEDGRLPVFVVAYYFIHEGRSTDRRRTLITLMLSLGALLGFLHPVVLHLSGRAAFGASAAGRAVHGIRMFCLVPLFAPVYLYLSFPVLDALQRDHMSLAILSAFGRGEARAERLVRKGAHDPLFHIQSLSDLRAFWCLGRLLGPSYEIGLLMRYSSAFTAVHVFFLCVATGALVASSWSGEVAWGVIAELSVLFASGAVAVAVASLYGVFINSHVSMYVALARQAALRYPELGSVAKDICAGFAEEHRELNPVRIMYIPATPALLSLLWSGLVVLSTFFISAIPAFCMPFLVFGRGCSMD